jgi:hypothetical protein
VSDDGVASRVESLCQLAVKYDLTELVAGPIEVRRRPGVASPVAPERTVEEIDSELVRAQRAGPEAFEALMARRKYGQ